jgi:hypothetical protein
VSIRFLLKKGDVYLQIVKTNFISVLSMDKMDRMDSEKYNNREFIFMFSGRLYVYQKNTSYDKKEWSTKIIIWNIRWGTRTTE